MYIYQDEIKLEQKLKNLPEITSKSVLDIGCNVGELHKFVKGDYIGYDIDKSVIEEGKKRYPRLDLRVGDIMDCITIETDLIIALALFHHLDNEKLEKAFELMDCNELIFEVPVGTKKFSLYHVRSKEYYTDLALKYFEDVRIVKSGATNDPYNERLIFICKNGKTKGD